MITEVYETLVVDHRFVEKSLRDRETTLRDLVSAIPAAVYACDSEGRLIYHNRYATDLWGREPRSNEEVWAFLPLSGLSRGPLSSAAPVLGRAAARRRDGEQKRCKKGLRRWCTNAS